MKNKRKIVLASTVILLLLISLYYYAVTNAFFPLSKSRALELGEGKYLNFLWMVDGAFNDERYHDSFTVNGKEMSTGHKLITCIYPKNNNKTCSVKNFEEKFYHLFANNITIDNVYGDGLSFKWYEKKNDEYLFTNLNTCSVLRMSNNHRLEVRDIEKDKITYEVLFSDDLNDNDYSISRKFVLVYEDKVWKISEAYYHDLCHMNYYLK